MVAIRRVSGTLCLYLVCDRLTFLVNAVGFRRGISSLFLVAQLFVSSSAPRWVVCRVYRITKTSEVNT